MAEWGNVNTEPRTPKENVRWTEHDLSDMQQYFWRAIAPDAAADGIDVETEKPTSSWLTENDYRPFVTALRRHHDLTFGEFWSSHIAPEQDVGAYDWGTDDADTIEALEHFLDRRASRYSLSDSSIDTLRYRLNAFVRAFKSANDHADLLSSVGRESDTPPYQAVDEVFAAFDHLNESTGKADATISRIADIVEAFYAHLVSRRVAGTNPASSLDNEFKWDSGTSGDTPALEARHVQALYEAADSLEESLLVVALAAWGLRANEVASLHVGQIERDTDTTVDLDYTDDWQDSHSDHPDKPFDGDKSLVRNAFDEVVKVIKGSNGKWYHIIEVSPNKYAIAITLSGNNPGTYYRVLQTFLTDIINGRTYFRSLEQVENLIIEKQVEDFETVGC